MLRPGQLTQRELEMHRDRSFSVLVAFPLVALTLEDIVAAVGPQTKHLFGPELRLGNLSN